VSSRSNLTARHPSAAAAGRGFGGDYGGGIQIDAVIVNRDRAQLLAAALRSLEAALAAVGARGETVVVDNGSSDGSAELVARDFPSVRWIQLDANMGFPTAVEAGIEATSSPWVLLLNNDAAIEPDALERVFAAPIADDVGTVAMQMRFSSRPEIVNSAGIGVDVLGVSYDRCLGTPVDGLASEPCEVFGASAGAGLYRRAMLEEIGGFDRGFFLYLEDVDVAWRARMAGWRAIYVPEAVVWHDHSATSRHGSSFKYFHVGRGRVRLIARNADRRQLMRYGLQMLAYDLGYVVFAGVTDRTLAPLRGRLAGLREWRALRAATAARRRPVELEQRQGYVAALRRRRAWPTASGRPRSA
jgi:GT2 family glycosyltransferase